MLARTASATARGMTLILPSTASGIAEAAALLRAGGLVALPTETVYGLGADATTSAAVARIYAAKGRPAFNPLIAHVPDLASAEREGVFDRNARKLAEAFWPGPLTLVVPVTPTGTVADLARAGLASVGLRVPSHPAAQALMRAFGRPIAAPSANRSGHVSPTSAAHVLADLDGRIDAVLDGGNAEAGLESTIIACVDDAAYLLRPGAITRAMAGSVIGQPVRDMDAADDADAPASPGRLASHYAPRAAVRLDVDQIRPGEAVLTFGNAQPAGLENARIVRNLSETGNLVEAAANLYSLMRFLDNSEVYSIAIVKIPITGLGEAINDRLRRSAAPRTS